MLSALRLGGACRTFHVDRRGVSAVEFAFILPLMLMIWAGMAEMAHAIDNWRKVTQLARTVADITSQGDPSNTNPMTPATMTDILASSSAILRPFSSANVIIRITAMAVDLTGSPLHPKVCSSLTTNATALPKRTVGVASDIPIPVGLALQGQRYILAEVGMTYTPMIAGSLSKLLPGINASPWLSSSISWPTRGGVAYGGNPYTEVVLPSGAQCS